MTIPENLKYTKDHEWIRPNGKTAIVGITDFAQGNLGILYSLKSKPWENISKKKPHLAPLKP